MSGILNNKERMIDFIITNQGRRQMSDGRLRVEFASFTDSHTFYQASGSAQSNVAEDASRRIFFEAADRHQDIIVPELDAGFSMQPFRAGDFKIEGRTIASGTFKLNNAGIRNFTNELSGSAITDVANPLLNSLTQNFRDLKILKTEDLFSDTSDFKLTAHTASFVITNSELDFGVGDNDTSGLGPYGEEIAIKNLPNLFANRRFSHLPNFKYLPPINKKSDGEDPVPIGQYPKIGHLDAGVASDKGDYKNDELTYSELTSHLNNLQTLELSFFDTSRSNNFIAQVFDMDTPDNEAGGIEKLSIIDFGEFSDNDPESPGKHVYFVGKIREDEQGAQTYMNIFTIVID